MYYGAVVQPNNSFHGSLTQHDELSRHLWHNRALRSLPSLQLVNQSQIGRNERYLRQLQEVRQHSKRTICRSRRYVTAHFYWCAPKSKQRWLYRRPSNLRRLGIHLYVWTVNQHANSRLPAGNLGWWFRLGFGIVYDYQRAKQPLLRCVRNSPVEKPRLSRSPVSSRYSGVRIPKVYSRCRRIYSGSLF